MAKEQVEFPITGKVTTVGVKEGDKVSEGDVICLLESMKMENPILAPVSGKIVSVSCSMSLSCNDAGTTSSSDLIKSSLSRC